MYTVRYWNHDKTDQVEEVEAERASESHYFVKVYWDDGSSLAIPMRRIIDIVWRPKEEI